MKLRDKSDWLTGVWEPKKEKQSRRDSASTLVDFLSEMGHRVWKAKIILRAAVISLGLGTSQHGHLSCMYILSTGYCLFFISHTPFFFFLFYPSHCFFWSSNLTNAYSSSSSSPSCFLSLPTSKGSLFLPWEMAVRLLHIWSCLIGRHLN